jgi:ubiquitin-large subunit ribosomal protein L40e
MANAKLMEFLKSRSTLSDPMFNALAERFKDRPVVKLTSDRIKPSFDVSAKLRIDPKIPGKMEVFMRYLTGTSWCIKTNSYETIMDMMLRNQESQGIPPDQQRLVFAGTSLEPEHTLAHYNIQEGAVIHVIMRLRGGMYHASSGHSDLYKSFPLEVCYSPSEKPVTILVHGGITISKFCDTILRAVASIGRAHNDALNTHILIDMVPLASCSPDTDTLNSIGLSAESCTSFPTINLVALE